MIWNNISGDEYIRLWKHLREDIKDKSLQQQLDEVARFCAPIPFGARTLDYYSPENWPTPWEIIFYNSYCTSSISLLIFYTLALVEIKSIIELILVESDSGIFLLPIVDDQFILNYHLGLVSKYPDICNEFKVLKRYSQEQIKTIK